MIKHIIAAAMLAWLVLATPAQAEHTAKVFLEKIDGPNQIDAKIYRLSLNSIGSGIEWANTRIKAKGGQPLYCPPENLAIQPEQMIDMLRRLVKEYPSVGDLPAGLVLIRAYEATFPCSEKR
jgi:hypothetical protein